MGHRNARLTEFGRLLLVQRITELGWPPALAAESLGCRDRPPTNGLAATMPKAQPAWPIAAPGPTAARTRRQPARFVGCWLPAGAATKARIGSATTWGCPAPASMECCAATG
jgi:leucine-zipper of insertion element IS481